MESMANDLIHSFLPAGFGTVDDQVRVEQKSPALSGTKARAKSKLLFEVCIMQDDKEIGQRLHRRIIHRGTG